MNNGVFTPGFPGGRRGGSPGPRSWAPRDPKIRGVRNFGVFPCNRTEWGLFFEVFGLPEKHDKKQRFYVSKFRFDPKFPGAGNFGDPEIPEVGKFCPRELLPDPKIREIWKSPVFWWNQTERVSFFRDFWVPGKMGYKRYFHEPKLGFDPWFAQGGISGIRKFRRSGNFVRGSSAGDPKSGKSVKRSFFDGIRPNAPFFSMFFGPRKK